MESNKPIKLRGFMTNITELKMREEKIKYISFHDSLTGLYNREFLDAEIERLDVKRQLPLSMIMIDLNGLKIINDSYGHKTGDKFLIKTAELLNDIFRDEDIIARWGGDEFVILISKLSEKKVEKIVNRIKSIDYNVQLDFDQEIPLSLSVGYAIKKSFNVDINYLFKQAEDMMYKDKLLNKQSSSSHIVNSLLSTLQESGDETKEHGERMSKLAIKLGKKINLSTSELNRLALLAILHDIGKITIPKEILNKKNKLTNNDWLKIKRTPINWL
ncbi:MAG: diguanylate cyclase [Halanaerobiales bacterium]|nr:diguanylate cyclase [Halanaerobiales bacterium]